MGERGSADRVEPVDPMANLAVGQAVTVRGVIDRPACGEGCDALVTFRWANGTESRVWVRHADISLAASAHPHAGIEAPASCIYCRGRGYYRDDLSGGESYCTCSLGRQLETRERPPAGIEGGRR